MTSFLDLITPTNLEAEEGRFFASTSYHPTFHYAWENQSIRNYSQTEPLKQELVKAVKDQDHGRITSVARDLFQVSAGEELHLLGTKLVRDQDTTTHSGTARQYAALLQQAFQLFDLDYRAVISKASGFNARPNHRAKTIVISEGIHYEFFSLVGGVRHELAHIIRYQNGEHNHVKRSPNYLPTEEGLASYVQDHTKGVTDRGYVQHAIEYLGSEIGARGSLRDIYNFMRESGMSKELAWKRAARHKFGFINTSLPGDIMKPAMYFANEVEVGKLSQDEKLRLFVGKIDFHDLDRYPLYSGLWPADKIISYFNL